MKLKVFFLSLLASCSVFAQKSDIWTSFYDNEEYLFGFKNSKGEVMIEPKFMGFTSANKFDKIAAFMEDTNGEFSSYYMLKKTAFMSLIWHLTAKMKVSSNSEILKREMLACLTQQEKRLFQLYIMI